MLRRQSRCVHRDEAVSRIRVVLNSLSGVGLFLTDAIVSLIMTPIIVLSLGNRDYGLWELMLSIVGYLGILDIGMGPAVMRDVAHAEARSDTSQRAPLQLWSLLMREHHASDSKA